METIISIWELFSPSTWKKIFLGHNVKKEWYPIAAEDSKIVLRKCRQPYRKKIEFIIRNFFIALMAFIILQIYVFLTENESGIYDNVFTEMIINNFFIFCFFLYVILFLLMFVIARFSFTSTIVGINTRNNGELKKIHHHLYIFFFLFCSLFFIYCIVFDMIPIIFNIPIIVMSIGILFLSSGIYLNKRLKASNIHTFCSGNRYYDYEDPEVVRIDKDIFLAIKENINGQTVNHLHHINLLVNNLYICDNNDILIIPKDGEPVIYKPNEISAIKIKDARIIYRDSKWQKENTSS